MFLNLLSNHNWLASSAKSSTEDDYQRQALFQNIVLFWASLVGAYLAFALGLLPVFYQLLMYPYVPWQTAVLSSALGAILELVSGSLFRQMRETKKLVMAHHKQMREDKHLEEAERITLTIEDAVLRDREKRYLVRAHVRTCDSRDTRTPRHGILSALLKPGKSDSKPPTRRNSSIKL